MELQPFFGKVPVILLKYVLETLGPWSIWLFLKIVHVVGPSQKSCVMMG